MKRRKNPSIGTGLLVGAAAIAVAIVASRPAQASSLPSVADIRAMPGFSTLTPDQQDEIVNELPPESAAAYIAMYSAGNAAGDTSAESAPVTKPAPPNVLIDPTFTKGVSTSPPAQYEVSKLEGMGHMRGLPNQPTWPGLIIIAGMLFLLMRPNASL